MQVWYSGIISDCQSEVTSSILVSCSNKWACRLVVNRFLDTEKIVGSIPTMPTICSLGETGYHTRLRSLN